jgi:hypothetical protein
LVKLALKVAFELVLVCCPFKNKELETPTFLLKLIKDPKYPAVGAEFIGVEIIELFTLTL